MNITADQQHIFAALIENSEDAIISKDLTSRITTWNPAAERMFGYTAEEMIGQYIHRLIPADRQHEEDTIIAKLKRGERVEHFQTMRLTKHGKQLQLSLTISPIRDPHGKIIGASKIARDISIQRLNEERLRVVNDLAMRINAKLDVDAILQVVTDASTKVSGAAFGAFFYNKIDEQGQSYMLYALSGAPRDAFDKFGMPRNTAVFNPTFAGLGVIRSADIRKDPRYGHNTPYHGMPEGHLPVVSYLAVPVKSQDGVVIGGLFFGHPDPDKFSPEHENLAVAIASQAAIALENAKLLQEVNLLSSRKDEFIGFASHELKTPLTTIKGYLQLAKDNTVTIDKIYPKLEKQVDRLETIINDLLDISRIHAGKLDLKFEHISLSKLITDCVTLIEPGSRTMNVQLPKEDGLIYVDAQKLSLVIVNLLSNAVKYSSDNTTITLSVLILGDEVQISVKDNGVGIPAPELSQIFDPYYRVSSKQHRAKGAGLGLFIAKEIVSAHRGRIWAESEFGHGSTFNVVIPLEKRKNSN
ncbi:MAG: ATP-binding protein [Chitinophagaceae bacterium]